jgi:hypothetical protein
MDHALQKQRNAVSCHGIRAGDGFASSPKPSLVKPKRQIDLIRASAEPTGSEMPIRFVTTENQFRCVAMRLRSAIILVRQACGSTGIPL